MVTPTIFDQARLHAGRGFDWENDPVEFMLVDTTLWTPDATADQFVGDIIAAGAVDAGDRVAIINPAVSIASHRALWAADDYSHTGVANLADYDAIVAYALVTNDADSWLITVDDLGVQTGDGSSIAINFGTYVVRF